MKKLIKEIRYARFRNEMSQQDMSKKLDLSINRYSQIESDFENSFRNIKMHQFLKICKSLDQELRDKIFNYDYLLTEWENE